MRLIHSLILAQSTITGVLGMGGVQSSQIAWEIDGDNCDIVQTFGYALKSCYNEQEVRSTTYENDVRETFDQELVVRAFPSKEGSSSAFLIQEAGGIYYQILEMQASADGVALQPVGSIKPKNKNSPIVDFHLDKEGGYGFFMHESGAFQYFDYDNNAQYW